jgi:hypothetical protein
MELIYECLDADLAQVLRVNASTPEKGQKYHLWHTGQYGLKKLIEHIWKVIGIASTCAPGQLDELQYKMEQLHDKEPFFKMLANLSLQIGG